MLRPAVEYRQELRQLLSRQLILKPVPSCQAVRVVAALVGSFQERGGHGTW